MERWIDFFLRGKYILTTLVRDNGERKEQFKEIAKFFEIYEKSEEIREMSKKYNLLAKLLKIDEITSPSLAPTDDESLKVVLDEILTTISEIEKAAQEEYEKRQAARLAEQEARINELQEQRAAEQSKEEEKKPEEEEDPEEEIQIEIVRRVPTH